MAGISALFSKFTFVFIKPFCYITNHLIATFRLENEDDYEYEFSVLSTRFRFEG